MQEYIKRFAIAMQSIDELSDEVAALGLQSGLKTSNYVRSLARKSAATLAKAMKRAYQEMDMEEMLKEKFRKARKKQISL